MKDEEEHEELQLLSRGLVRTEVRAERPFQQ
jgi:hypothetical protein